MYENEADGTVRRHGDQRQVGAEATQGTIRAEWLRRRREGRRRFRQHDDDSILSQATDLRNEDYTLFRADVKTALLDAHMKDGDVVYAKLPPEWQPETLDSSKGTVIWKLQKSLHGLRSAPRRWQGPSGADPQKVRLRPEHA